jgi:hypothetical protein
MTDISKLSTPELFSILSSSLLSHDEDDPVPMQTLIELARRQHVGDCWDDESPDCGQLRKACEEAARGK